MAQTGKVSVTTDKDGYTLFKIDERKILAYLKEDGQHYLIITERPAQTTQDPQEATSTIMRVLEEEGGDVVGFATSPGCPFLFPL